ncbi:MAG: tRNA pseudouridine(55) synthase TruB [Clostridia bacterium]|nr:tRNA pseudouridine(55) synthase TruB [Clostridia bacterium]
MDGVINVLKPAGISSHDVVQQIRKILRTKKVGHTGTLDPDAIGVLPICIGKATRLAEYLTASTKRYRALMVFGYETDTQDSSGKIIKTSALPVLEKEQFEKALGNFVGEIEQIPPMFSALKVKGQPLYKLAREGKDIQREARKIHIYDLKLIDYNYKSALIDVTCSKGTYIRTLCQDIGRAINSGAYMSFLMRIESGIFHIQDAFTLEEINQLNPEIFLISMSDSLRDWPVLKFSDRELMKIAHGNSVPITTSLEPVFNQGKYKVLDKNQELLAIGFVKENYFKPEKVFR